jgi:hypothetical protein
MSAKEMSPEAVAALGHILSVYGYIVVAFDHPVPVGKIFTMFAGEWSTVQPFRVMAPATYEEWQGQLEDVLASGT